MNWNHRKCNREIMPPLLTFLILLMIVSIAGTTRINVKTTITPAKASSSISFQDGEQYLFKSWVFMMLLNNSKIPLKEFTEKDNTYFVYANTLKRYMDNSDTQLEKEEADQVKEKVLELIDVMSIEQESDFTKMSLDGRAVAVDIAKQIYSLCGLSLTTDIEGRIINITDSSGNIMYGMKERLRNYDFQVYACIVTFLMILTLIGVILVIGKKKNLFKKEDICDEFNEERFA